MTDRSHSEQTRPPKLHGARVLVVEDEYYIADEVCEALRAAGARIVGPLSTLCAASDAIAAGEFDCAVIDLNLRGEDAEALADQLLERGKPFAIATGYDTSGLRERLKDVPRIEKPFGPTALLRLVAQLSCAETDA